MKLKDIAEVGMVILLLAAGGFMMAGGIITALWWFTADSETDADKIYLQVVVCSELLRFLIAAVCFGASAILVKMGAVQSLLDIANQQTPIDEVGGVTPPPVAGDQ